MRQLAQHPQRHLIPLIATPHSDIEGAFRRLLGLLHPSFERWELADLDDPKSAALARHLVQRTQKDILVQSEGGVSCFAEREPARLFHPQASLRGLNCLTRQHGLLKLLRKDL